MADEFDDSVAPVLLGAYVLAGITYLDYGGLVKEQRQVHGRVVRASTSEGVILEIAGGEEFWLPPDPTGYDPAEPGQYRLRSTGEIVVDPDYITGFMVEPPDHH